MRAKELIEQINGSDVNKLDHIVWKDGAFTCQLALKRDKIEGASYDQLINGINAITKHYNALYPSEQANTAIELLGKATQLLQKVPRLLDLIPNAKLKNSAINNRSPHCSLIDGLFFFQFQVGNLEESDCIKGLNLVHALEILSDLTVYCNDFLPSLYVLEASRYITAAKQQLMVS